MEREMQDYRTSLWSVPAKWAGVYLWLFTLQSTLWLVVLIIREVRSDQPDNIFEKAINVGVDWAPLMIVSAGVSMLLVEVPMVFAEKYLYHRYNLGLEEGIEQGIEQGIEVGAQKERERWEVYRERVEEAHRLGQAPPEPPAPSEESTNGYQRR